MFILNWLVAGLAILKDFACGFTQSEVLDRRSEWMFTVWLTIMIITGFRPFFVFLKRCYQLLLVKPLGWLFKKKKAQYLKKLVVLQDQKIAQLMKEKEEQMKELSNFISKHPKLKNSLEVKKEPQNQKENQEDE
ncbi:hypothetical protein AXA84_0254 [Candidatus Phytoplasma oryzae]|uniref:Uncharacterized protein n=1 Tax=Candidatus Phytoplasma oryzae TaxID=203274 RepID=A0A139JQH8_9MOLU|nr:hypothetical protein [Candidatus Phytoplasma oryzae]KXT29225.1 hypothetical protein AXA84_0254 [Candidatus Phytoplasma oryzae]